MLNELSDYFFSNKIYEKLHIDKEGSLEEDDKFSFDTPRVVSPNFCSSMIYFEPFIFDWCQQVASITNATGTALAVYYPPGGYLGWHTNDDCVAHNLILTYSASDKSYFESRQKRIYDTKGWSIKINEFNRDSSWHRAIAIDHRITFAFIYDTKEKRDIAVKKFNFTDVQNWKSNI